MKIIAQSKEFTKMELYALTESPDVRRMKDAVGQELPLVNWLEYEQTGNDGEDRTILAIETEDHEVYATASESFIRQFHRAADVLGDEFKNIKIFEGTSKAGRQFMQCAAK